jgi:eukaryotic-like serine/threonine-protein kinase
MADVTPLQQLQDLQTKGLATAEEVAEARRLLESAFREGRNLPATEALAAAVATLKARAEDKTPTEDADAQAIQGSDLQLISRIGRGTQAVVYKCRQITMDRMVAVKFLHMAAARDPELRERFFQEARHAAKLSHPNIVAVHQIRPYKDTFYIVMELVDGGSLAELLALRKRLDVAEAVGIIRAAAEGLACAHASGIVHRDIKPKNLLLTEGGIVKLADLGLARRTDDADASLDKPGKAYGTPYYIAPEQIAADPNVNGRADIYSLGATFFEMVTGRPPFTAATPREVLRKHMTEPPPDPQRFVPSLPPAIGAILQKCLAKRPEDRYGTAEDLIAAIDKAFFGAGEAAGAGAGHQELMGQLAELAVHRREDIDAVIELGRTPARKPPWIAIGVGAALVAAIAFAAFVVLPHLREAPPPPKTPAKPTVAAVPQPVPPPVGTIVPTKSGAVPSLRPSGGTVVSITPAPGTTPAVVPPVAVVTGTGGTGEPPAGQLVSGGPDAVKYLKLAKTQEADPGAKPQEITNAYAFVVKWYPKTLEAAEAQEALNRLTPTTPLPDTVAVVPPKPDPPEVEVPIPPPTHPDTVVPPETVPDVKPPVVKPPVAVVKPPAPKVALYVNCGGGAVKSDGIDWVADQTYGMDARRGFSWGFIGNGTNGVRHDSPLLRAHPVFMDERYGTNLGYQFDVPPGRYTVTVGFAENKFTARNGRVFGFEVTGATPGRQDLDIFSLAGGKDKPYTRAYSITVTAGKPLLLKFFSGKDTPMVNAIQVVQE